MSGSAEAGRRLIVTSMISVDGVAEAPGGEEGYRNEGWTFRHVDFDAAAYELKGREQEEAGSLLMGRRSYELFAPVWPSMAEFERYNAIPRQVVSTTLETDDPRWPAGIIRSLDDVARMKTEAGGPILVHGSLELAAALAEADLVDRYHLLVFPVLLGAGRRLFASPDRDAVRLHLVEHAAYPNGVQLQVFDVIR